MAGPFRVLFGGQAGRGRDEQHLVLLVGGRRLTCGFEDAAIVARLGNGWAVLRANRPASFHHVFINPSAPFPGYGDDGTADHQIAIEPHLDPAEVIVE